MKIGEFSKLSSVPKDTLRYYEKIGLLRGITRDGAGRRDFQAADFPWIQFIRRLKDTGMPLSEIKRYADLRQRGPSTIKARYVLLQQHASVLEDKMAAEQMNLDRLHEKLAFYKKEMKRKTAIDLELAPSNRFLPIEGETNEKPI